MNSKSSMLLCLCAVLLFASCTQSPSPPVAAISPASRQVTFGDRQVAQMLADRPDMAGVLPENHAVMRWIVKSFNGGRTGFRVYWNADSPGDSGASHAPRYGGYPAQLLISGGTETTPIDKWAGVVYEFFNLENTEGFAELLEQARTGEIDGHEYAFRCTKLEFDAAKKTEAYFASHPLPKIGVAKNEWYEWITSGVGSFEEQIEDYPDPTKPGNYVYFKKYYDEDVAPWVGVDPNKSNLAETEQ